ncbi:MAG TPA: hypothetical protein O0X70_05225 [Methanocorpusculum sp.]|nr:hypothetical protein [Methanocorpusculum sp.]
MNITYLVTRLAGGISEYKKKAALLFGMLSGKYPAIAKAGYVKKPAAEIISCNPELFICRHQYVFFHLACYQTRPDVNNVQYAFFLFPGSGHSLGYQLDSPIPRDSAAP